MLETDMFQLILLGLVGLCALLLLWSVVRLGRIRRLLAERPSAAWTRVLSEEGTGRETREANSVEGEPADVTRTEEARVAGAGGGGGAAYGSGDATAQQTGAAAAEPPEPQEQPFERNGRWYFRRGDELLIYDEQTGQWGPAPSGAPTQPGGARSNSPVSTGGHGSGAGSAAQSTATRQSEASMWKCPSCGAVNGSTSDTCRMCFTRRP